MSLSVINFFLRYVIIAGIGIVLALYPLLNRVSGASTAVKPVSVQTEMIERETVEHIAIIAAAVYATMAGAYRIVSTEPANAICALFHRRPISLGGPRVCHGSMRAAP